MTGRVPDEDVRVRLLTSPRPGETAQVLALAESLGWSFETDPTITGAKAWIDGLTARTATAPASASAPPDLVISAGPRSEPVARGYRANGDGRTRIVHVGRPWAPIDSFDLVVGTPQDRLPQHPNVLEVAAPLHRVTPQRLATEARAWEPRIADLPRPWVTVLVGGPRGAYPFGRRAARRLARDVNAMADRCNGSAIVAVTPRTPKAVARTLARELGPATRMVEALEPAPRIGLMGLADAIVTTGDDLTSLGDALATGKDVRIFDPGIGRGTMRKRATIDVRERNDFSPRSFFYRQMMLFGPRRFARDLTRVHRGIVGRGAASWLGESKSASTDQLPDPNMAAVRRIRRMLGLAEAPPASGAAGNPTDSESGATS